MKQPSNLNTFLLEIRLALELNPVANPDRVIKNAAGAMQRQHRFDETSTAKHVAGALAHPTPIRVLQPAIDMHHQMTGI
ncbi:hypothetical protein [Oceanobacter sp. 4_MG-2023]|uniref:hypothetical protein n=1 Tax=Oceanobacter sp. 4_MG-2023 TaxID=3062623 RepID=UPI002732822D|nr:hypothetical protein [Oceanobacter sp. 4_MG-2023]MDP2548883.1 hypothetical protein [Oceanobacter sp. 4_MG-2023]